MKLLITIFTFIVCGGMASSEPLTTASKEKFVAFYRTWSKFEIDFPNHPEVKVLFVDIDNDGMNEAIATDRGQFGETGYSWNVFQFNDGAWSAAKIKIIDETTVDPTSGIFARSEEFYLLSTTSNSSGLIVIHKDFDKLEPNGMAAPQVFSISLDKGDFVATKQLGVLDQLIGYSQDFHKLERLGVETFDK